MLLESDLVLLALNVKNLASC